MAINYFETLFEARELKVQQERIYRGESVDLVARITSDGVPASLTGYTVEGLYQPVSYRGSEEHGDEFFELPAEITQDGKQVIVHWTYDKDFGEPAYCIWALLTKSGETSYPVSWRMTLEYSPSYPVSAAPEPLPKTLDFSKYTLLNAPWLPLAGGTCTGNVQVNANLSVTGNETIGGNVTITGKLKSGDIAVNDSSITQVCIGSGAGQADGAAGTAVAIGYRAKTNAFGVAIGTGANVATDGGVALGFGASAAGNLATAIGRGSTASGLAAVAVGQNSSATSEGAIAIGYGTDARAANAIQIGAYTSDSGVWNPHNDTPNSVQFFNKQVFQTTGTPSADPASNNVILVRERAPWAVSFNDVATVATTGSYNDLTDKPDLTVYALKNELTVTPGTGTDADKTTIQLKSGTSATVLTAHQDISGKADKADQFYLPYGAASEQGGNITSLRTDRSVYRMNMSMDPDTGEVIFGNISSNAIPTKSAYFCFEIEATIPQGALTLDTTMFGVTTWVEGFGLPATGFAGKTLYISCRLDCTERTILASCWRVA